MRKSLFIFVIVTCGLAMMGCPSPNPGTMSISPTIPSDGDDVPNTTSDPVLLNESDGSYFVDFDEVSRAGKNATYRVSTLTEALNSPTNYAINLVEGTVWIRTKVAPTTGPIRTTTTNARRYRVVSHGRRVGSTGSSFIVTVKGDKTMVITVFDGEATVWGDGKDDTRPIVIKAGSTATIKYPYP